MSDPIVLATLNSKFIHTAFGLRCLYANLGPLQAQARILEYTISQGTREIAEAILKSEPRVVGFGIYIWNVRQTQEVVSILKRLRPEIIIVVGGPEVSYEFESQPLCQIADFTFSGEADFLLL